MKKITWIAPFMASMFLMGCNKPAEQTETTDTEETVQTTTEEAPAMVQEATMHNTLSEAEQNDGWLLLFDGKTSDGWRSFGEETFPSDWKITDNGELYFAASQREEGSQNGGDIIYDKEFSNFHLKLEWKIAKAGNSGIFYLGKETHDYIWKTAPEMQVLDNENHPDATNGENGNRKAGSLYDIYPATPQNAKPFGEWNSVEIIHNNGKVQHIQNGEVVVEYDINSDKFKEDVAASKFPGLNENWVNIATSGYFGLQDHGDDVWFRNIKIKEL